MKKYLLLISISFALFFTGCGGGGGDSSSTTTTNVSPSQIDIEGEWPYTSTIANCNKEEKGTIVLEKLSDNSFSWRLSTNNGLESDCTYSGPFSTSGTYSGLNISSSTASEFKNFYDTLYTTSSVEYISTGEIKVTTSENGVIFTTTVIRDNNAFDGANYSGYYALTTGNSSFCDASGSFSSTVTNGIVSGIVVTGSGQVTATGFEISNGKYSGILSDGYTAWEGYVTSNKVYGTYTYKNGNITCEGTYTGNVINAP